MKNYALTLIAACFYITANSQINGIFSVYGAGADYSSLQTALDDLSLQGVDGDVTLNLRSGVYSEQITIDSIPGAAADAQIIIQSESLDSADVRFNYTATGFTDDFVFKFNSCSWLTLQYITIQPTGPGGFSTYSRAIEFASLSHHNAIRYVHFLGRPFVNALTLYSAQGNFSEYNSIEFCHFKYGGTAISYRNDGSFSLPNGKGLTIRNCLFEDQNYTAISAINNDAFLVENNIVINPEQGNNISAMYFGNIEKGGIIRNNQIYVKGLNGLEISNSNNDNGYQTEIYNNMISLNGSSYGNALIVSAPGNTSATNFNILVAYNSLAVSNSGAQQAMQLFRVDSAQIVNNILYTQDNGIPLLIQGGIGSDVVFSHNCFYSADGNLAQNGIGGTIYNSFIDLENDVAFISQCIAEDPSYFSESDLHSSNELLANAGIPVESILTDIDNELRDPVAPSIGADELNGQPLKALESSKINLACFPNPANTSLHVTISGNKLQTALIQIFDLRGKLIQTEKVSGTNYILNVSAIPSGMYLLRLSTEKESSHASFIVQ